MVTLLAVAVTLCYHPVHTGQSGTTTSPAKIRLHCTGHPSDRLYTDRPRVSQPPVHQCLISHQSCCPQKSKSVPMSKPKLTSPHTGQHHFHCTSQGCLPTWRQKPCLLTLLKAPSHSITKRVPLSVLVPSRAYLNNCILPGGQQARRFILPMTKIQHGRPTACVLASPAVRYIQGKTITYIKIYMYIVIQYKNFTKQSLRCKMSIYSDNYLEKYTVLQRRIDSSPRLQAYRQVLFGAEGEFLILVGRYVAAVGFS